MISTYNIKDINSLPTPDILEIPTFWDIVRENQNLLYEIDEKYKQLAEDEDIRVIIEAFAYRELHLRALVNLKIKNMLPHYATGADLDNFIFGFYGGVTRLKGSYPFADFRFTLLGDDNEIVIPNGEVVYNSAGYRGRVVGDVKLSTQNTSQTVRVELLEYIEKSDVELTDIDSFFGVKVEQLSSFLGGAENESDARFLERSLLSMNRFSTAGSVGSYYYHVMNADVRVDTAYVYSPALGVVRVVLDNFDGYIDDTVLHRIEEILTSDDIKPLTDKVEVQRAEHIEITIKAELKLFDLFAQHEIDKKIKDNFSKPLKINEDLTYSDILHRLHVAGVYSAKVDGIVDDICSSFTERIVIVGVECVYIKY